MDYQLNLDGTCIVCCLPTPVSRNTITVDGVVCSLCNASDRSPEAARRVVASRIKDLEGELRRLRRLAAGF